MNLIRTPSTDPAFNLAAEEYLLRTVRAPACMLWRNEKAVIVGKNQDTAGEIDQAYVEAHGIRVIRRLTGGGAVFHDLGNVNYTFIEPEGGGHFNDYAWFTADLISYLAALGVKAEQNDRNDVLADGKKICGNAQCVMNGMVMHHGCILYDADLSALARALKPDPEKLRGKGIASVAARVANIRALGDLAMDAAAFMNGFADYMKRRHGCIESTFSAEDTARMQRLADEKYSTWAWNFGSSPDWDGRISP